MTLSPEAVQRLIIERLAHCERTGMTAVSWSVEEMRELQALLVGGDPSEQEGTK